MKPEEAKTIIQSTAELNTTYLGYRVSNLDVRRDIVVNDEDRTLHTMITGPTGTGKTNFMISVFLQDIQKGGAAFLSPKGNAINEILAKLPDDRLDDVIYINPAEDRCPGINLLTPEITSGMSESEHEKQRKIVVSNIMALIRRYSDDIGERWPRNLRSLIAAHVALNVHNDEQNTLMDVYECLEDNRKLVDLMNRVPDQVIRTQLDEIRKLSDREKQPHLRRLSDLVENRLVRRIITQPESSISFHDALANQKIILVDAQGGTVGDWAARVLGSVVLTQLWSATAARATIPENERPFFSLHIDEIQEFINESDLMERMFSQCREFQVSVNAATQILDLLDPSLRKAILNNTLTKVVFSPGASEDLSTYTRIMNGLSKEELTRLGKYRPAVQRPATETLPEADIMNTYPPWDYDPETLEERKAALLNKYDPLDDRSPETEVSTGDSAASGSETHDQLLVEAKQFLEFEETGVTVNLLHQDGASRPDAHVIGDDGVVHLEAEHSTLTHPEKVLTNLERAQNEGRKCIFIVEESRLDRLEDILEDQDGYRVLVLTDLGVTEP